MSVSSKHLLTLMSRHLLALSLLTTRHDVHSSFLSVGFIINERECFVKFRNEPRFYAIYSRFDTESET